MICLACLLPLFLIPVVNALPLLFQFIISKIYRLFGWEYQKREMVPPACPYKPADGRNTVSAGGAQNKSAQLPAEASSEKADKQE